MASASGYSKGFSYTSSDVAAVGLCGLCRNPVMARCQICEGNLAGPNAADASAQECRVARGVCGHVFHLHCISVYLPIREFCPMGKKHVWEFRRGGEDESGSRQ